MPKITLKAARVNANITQEEAANYVGVSTATIKNWESGKTYPLFNQAVQLCELYGISIDMIKP